MTKIMNGHGDLIMGLLCGRKGNWEPIPKALSTWGMTCGPIDCWLAERGLSTLYVRVREACATAMKVAEFLSRNKQVKSVSYPGLRSHPDHELAKRILNGSGEPAFGHMVTFGISGGSAAATRLIARLEEIHFCASLGELTTTLSHPASTSHRGQTQSQMAEIGIDGGTIRLSIGLESPEFVCESLDRALATMDG